MDLGIQGKKAIVCASSKGLGKNVAECLAAEGVELLLCSRSEDSIRPVAEELAKSASSAVHWVACDLSSEEGRNQLISKAKEALGTVDIILHNTGGPPPTSVEDTTLDAWRDGWEANFISIAHLNQAFLPAMKSQGWGRIVVITSLSPMQPIPDLAISNGVRAGVTAMLKTLSAEVAKDGVTVNCVAPGIIHTDRTETRIQAYIKKNGGERADILAKYASDIPTGRLGRPDEFGPAVAFLCSEQASYITGTSLCVDGGKRKSTF